MPADTWIVVDPDPNAPSATWPCAGAAVAITVFVIAIAIAVTSLFTWIL